MTTAEIGILVTIGLTLLGFAGRLIYKLGAGDRDTLAVREWKQEVLNQLASLNTSQQRTSDTQHQIALTQERTTGALLALTDKVKDIVVRQDRMEGHLDELRARRADT